MVPAGTKLIWTILEARALRNSPTHMRMLMHMHNMHMTDIDSHVNMHMCMCMSCASACHMSYRVTCHVICACCACRISDIRYLTNRKVGKNTIPLWSFWCGLRPHAHPHLNNTPLVTRVSKMTFGGGFPKRVEVPSSTKRLSCHAEWPEVSMASRAGSGCVSAARSMTLR